MKHDRTTVIIGYSSNHNKNYGVFYEKYLKLNDIKKLSLNFFTKFYQNFKNKDFNYLYLMNKQNDFYFHNFNKIFNIKLKF